MAKYQELADAIIRGDNVKSKEITQELVSKGVPATEILNEGLIAGDVYKRQLYTYFLWICPKKKI